MKPYILLQYWLLLLCISSACSVMDVTLPDTNQFLAESSNQTIEPQFQSMTFAHMVPTLEELNLWLAIEMETLYGFGEEDRQNPNIEQEASNELSQERQEILLEQDISKLLQYLWAEYPSEETEQLAKETLLRYYTMASCEIVALEQEMQSMDYILNIVLTPLLFPEYLDQSYIQENFLKVTEGVQLSDLSLEEYSHYDNLSTIALLEEILQLETLPTGEQVECSIRLYSSTGTYTLSENQWMILHNSLFPAK